MKIGISCRFVHASKALRSLLYGEKLLELLKTTMPTATAVRHGTGSHTNPYAPTTIGEWFWLAKRETDFYPMYIWIGNRLIARWGKGAGPLQDYVTDVTGHADMLEGIEAVGDLFGSYEDQVRGIKKDYDEADKSVGIDIDLPVYTRKALRLSQFDDRALAMFSRRVMSGIDECDDCPELASTLASLFIAEAHRSAEQAIFIVGLMLLDLVETATTYGSGGEKTYTWKSMLMHHLENDVKPHAIEGRGAGLKLLGKHPMAGAGSAAAGRGLFSWLGANATRDRAVSILATWLAHYMTKKHPCQEPTNFTFFIVSNKGGAPPQVMNKGDEGLKGNIKKAIKDRCDTLDLMIGGTTVYYEDVKGNQV